MDWLNKIKDKIMPASQAGNDFQSSERRNPRLPSTILALCSVATRNDAVFSVTISDLGITGVRIDAPRPIEKGSVVDIRVPVGKNFENRDTQEFVAFRGTSMWSRRAGSVHQVGIRYTEARNDVRDRWIALVLEAYGFSLLDSAKRGEIRCAADFPVKATLGGARLTGRVMNISMGGMLAVLEGAEPPAESLLQLELGPIGDAPLLELTARVARTRPEHMDDSYLVAMAFDALTEEQRQLLVRCLSLLSKA